MLWWRYSRHKYRTEWEKCATADCKYLFRRFSDNLICKENIIFQQRPEFKDYENKTLLMLGGGGSTNTMDWDRLGDYDYIWSANHFFLHPILKNKKMDLVMMMAEPNLKGKEWLEYRNKFRPLVGVEVSGKWDQYPFDSYEKYFCMHTYRYDILGACVRMIEFACELGISHLDFIGLDGIEATMEGNHAFQPGKTTIPTGLAHYKNLSPAKIYQKEYDSFWDYIIDKYPTVSFKNLGGGEKYHEKVMRHHSG